MKTLINEILQCKTCQNFIDPNPVFSVSKRSKIIIVGQAPGRIVHETKIPWDDKSGENLRNWLQVDTATFYDTDKFGLMPMGFCYPGKGKSGDLPPRTECAPLWHQILLDAMPDVKLIILIGQYAQNYYLQSKVKLTLTDTVKNFKEYLPGYFVLPHPSPRNNIWQAKNKWFEQEVIPSLRKKVKSTLKSGSK